MNIHTIYILEYVGRWMRIDRETASKIESLFTRQIRREFVFAFAIDTVYNCKTG